MEKEIRTKEADEATEERRRKLKKAKGSVTPEEWNNLSHKEREGRSKMACMHRSSTSSFGDLINNATKYQIPVPTGIDNEGHFIWEGFEGMIKTKKCYECGVIEGQYHLLGCDMERCPFCGEQLIICMCRYKKLGLIDYEKNRKKYAGLTYETYCNGLNDEQEEKWKLLLKEKGRIPWVQIPVLCHLCGKVHPNSFNIIDRNWKKFIIPELQNSVLCSECYEKMKKLFPEGWKMTEK